MSEIGSVRKSSVNESATMLGISALDFVNK